MNAELPVEQIAADSNTKEEKSDTVESEIDISGALEILVDAEPKFIEETWISSGKSLEDFNRRIFNALEHDSYPKKASCQQETEKKPQHQIVVPIECQCCYDTVPSTNAIECTKFVHTFCADCVTKACEVALGSDELELKCMNDCDGVISDEALKISLPTTLLEKFINRRQRGEIEQANLEGLLFCPYCDFAYILTEDDTTFICLNPNCLKKSCPLCKKSEHYPAPCENLAQDTIRKKVEEGMTEALLRKCFQCSKSFLKLDGCNKISCACGAIMCYICRQPVKNYEHFYGQGSCETWKCALWSTEEEVHVRPVIEAEERIRSQLIQPTSEESR